jgi:hypothetical protein
VIDPLPGPRTLAELRQARLLNEAVALAGPETTTHTGVRFAESHVAELTGLDVVLVDPHPAPVTIGRCIDEAARTLGCDHVVLLDVGGDVLAHGDEAGLASPVADAVCLAAAPALAAAGVTVLGALFGAGCDGELTPAEVLERVAEVTAGGGSLGAWGPDPASVAALAAAVAEIPTEASAMALRCARGETGTATIRGGRRTVELTPAGGLVFFFDPLVAIATAAHCAALVSGAGSLAEASDILVAQGMASELRYEQRPFPAAPDER